MKRYPIQLMAMDKTAHKAVRLLNTCKFDESTETDPSTFANHIVEGYRQILVLTEIEQKYMDALLIGLERCDEPIVVLPDLSDQESKIERLVSSGARVIVFPADSSVLDALSKTLRQLESLFYGNENANEIVVDHEDIYKTVKTGTVCRIYERDGEDFQKSVADIFENVINCTNVMGVYALFEVDEETPILEIAEAMQIIEDKVSEDAYLIFGTRLIKHESLEPKIEILTCFENFTNKINKSTVGNAVTSNR